MPRRVSNCPAWRVSSAATNATRPSVSRARGERSSMLPIGVATTYKVPRRTLLSLSLMSVIVGAACQPLQPTDTVTTLPPGREAIRRDTPPPPDPDEIWNLRPETRPPDTAMPAVQLPEGDRRIALIVPLSGRQQALGVAVRDGFIAAHLDTPPSRRTAVLILDEASLGPVEAYRRATDSGASLVVGPLLKESLQALSAVEGPVPVLALNNLGDGVQTGSVRWQFGLTPEDEAREVARRAIRLGQRRALTLTPDSEWGRRLLRAFAGEFATLGGELVASAGYDTFDSDYSQPIRGLLRIPAGKLGAQRPANPDESPAFGTGRRDDMDFIFIAANSTSGRQIMPQLRFFGAGNVPTYSTSAIWEDGSAIDDDLNGVIFPDCPWVVAPDGRMVLVKNGLVRHWGRSALGTSRLYALGHDAYRLVPIVLSQTYPGPFPGGDLPGTTGTLNADSTGRIYRRLAFAQIRDGQPVPLPAAGALFDAGPATPVSSSDLKP